MCKGVGVTTGAAARGAQLVSSLGQCLAFVFSEWDMLPSPQIPIYIMEIMEIRKPEREKAAPCISSTY